MALRRFFSLAIGVTKVHCIAMVSSLRRTTTFEFSFLQHSIPILLAFFSAKSANPTVFRMRILLAFFSAKSANSTVFRIPILLVTEIFLCEAYHFQKTSQTSDAQKNTPLVYGIDFCKSVKTDNLQEKNSCIRELSLLIAGRWVEAFRKFAQNSLDP